MAKIFENFVILKPDMAMDELHVGPDFYESLDRDYDGFKSHCLVSAHEFTENWPTWEVHPKGDEMVVLMAGSAEFVLKKKPGNETVHLSEPGAFVVVPRNTWHTARIDDYASLLFVTPGEGTRNESLPESSE